MVTDVQQTAYGYYLFTEDFLDCEFKAVFNIDAHGRNAFLVALQYFVVQGVYAVKLFYIFSTFEKHHALVIAPNHFRLVAVLLVTCTTLLYQFTQIVFIELYIHISVFIVLQR